jgi:multidrug efflux pump subunit AcrA (membrane-fusion protein)
MIHENLVVVHQLTLRKMLVLKEQIQMRQKRDPTPNARIRFLPVLWFTWAGFCILALCALGLYLSNAVMVPQTQSFAGTLRPNQSPMKLQLPAGVPLKALLVKSGETVRAGQTVAVLDQAAMRAKLSHIERSIVVANVLRTCLLEVSNKAGDTKTENIRHVTGDTGLRSKDGELRVLIQAARADCSTLKREEKQKKVRLERGLEVLQERLGFLNKKLAMVLGVHVKDTKKDVHPVLRAHASVSVALERNDLVQRLQTLSNELDALRVSQDKQRLVRVKNLSEDVATKLSQQAVLQTYLENPRLTVPENGMVSRVRPVPAGTDFDRDETILEVHGAEAAQYVADLRVPLDQISILPVGTEVKVILAGFTDRGPELQGVIERWAEGDSETGAHYAIARIRLKDESQILLSDPRNGIALRGTSTASVIRASLRDKTFKAMLLDTFEKKTKWVQVLVAG